MIIEAVSDRQTLWHQPIHWCVHGHWCTLISLLSHSDTYYFNETHGSLAEITGITKDHNFCQNFSLLSHSLSVSMHRFTLSQPCTNTSPTGRTLHLKDYQILWLSSGEQEVLWPCWKGRSVSCISAFFSDQGQTCICVFHLFDCDNE